jgi:CcmD family protein
MHIDTYTFGLIMAGFGNVRSTDALQYLALAYTVFFVAIFAYVISLSRRQTRVRDDLAVLRRVVDEEKARTEPR